MIPSKQRLRVGVALCGADLAGVAHVGVLCALEEMGVRVEHVAGSSSGSLVAALYAYGYRYSDFQTMVERFPGILLSDYGFPVVSSVFNLLRTVSKRGTLPTPHGLLLGHKLLKYIRNLLANREPQMEYSLVATDLYSTKAVVFTNSQGALDLGIGYRSTDVPREVLGSCAMPGLWTPITLGQWLLVDGGVRDIVPVQALRSAGCTHIIAVDLHRLPNEWRAVTTVDVIVRSMATLLDEAKQMSDLAGDDVFVLRPDLELTSWWSARKPMANNMYRSRDYTHRRASEINAFLRAAPFSDNNGNRQSNNDLRINIR